MRARAVVEEAGAWTKFKLLMWKNFLQQWRHPIQTVVELLLPVATMSLVLILRSELEPLTLSARHYPPIKANTLNYSIDVLIGMNVFSNGEFHKLSIAYSPESPMLEDVVRTSTVNLFADNMNDVIKLMIERGQDVNYPIDIPGNITVPADFSLDEAEALILASMLVEVVGYNSSEQLRGVYYEEVVTRTVIAGVEFDDDLLGATQLPVNVSYKLRFPERPRQNSLYGIGGRTWRTDLLFPAFERPGPRFPYSWEGGNDPGYVNEMFIALQHYISMELVSRLTGTEMRKFPVHIQRYPHPPHVEDLAVEALSFIFPLFIMLSFSYTAVNIIRNVTIEKELQLKETMKIMGLRTWLHWTAWFCKQMLYLLIAAVLLIVLLKVNWFTNDQGFSDYAVFTNTPWTVLFFFIWLYMACMIFFCFMISGFFSKASTAALCGGIIWFVSYIPAMLLTANSEVSTFMQTIICLSLNSAMSLGFDLILAKESTDGLQWDQFFSTHTLEGGRLLFGHVVLIVVFDCVLYMLIALYLEQVLPGPFGAPQPWYFLFQKSYWFSSSIVAPGRSSVNMHQSNIIKESEPADLPIGVKMIDLTKVYSNNVVVDSLNLNIYDDQITVLLGHNGAGKSTTISMLTGNVSVSSGGVWVAGYDISTQTSAARAHLGLCPQHDVLFNELTVREHIEFFARLKGYKGEQLNTEIEDLINSLEMQEKRNYQAQGLSGGQKRRLCVGIALSGGARVVLLDEPTSGMDPASRRALWDLLQRVKYGRSMILTTHFMDEADFLGDRVAIMASGRLQCVGSPFFLKRHYGVGYTLVIVKKEGFDEHACTALIQKYIPGIIISEDRGLEVTYKLPNENSHMFEEMLNELEARIDGVRYTNYGLVATTLEDVFMTVGTDVEVVSESEDSTILKDSEADVSDAASIEELDKVSDNETGWRLMWLHVSAIWLKLYLVLSRSWGMLALQVLVPIVQITANLGIMQYLVASQPTVISREFTLTQGFVSTETLISYNGTNATSAGASASKGYTELFEAAATGVMALTEVEGQLVDDYYLDRVHVPEMMGRLRNRLLIGATFDDDSAVAWFSNFGYHDVATSLAAVHAAILKGINSTYNLSVFNHPLEVNYRDNNDFNLMVTMLSTQVASSVGNALAIISAVYVMFYIRERTTRAKLLQKAAGVQPAVMWGAAAAFDWLWFLILSVIIIICLVAFQVVGMSSAGELGRLFLCLMIYGAAMLPLNYLLSLLFTGPAVGFVIMFFVNTLFGLIGAQMVDVLGRLTDATKVVADVLDFILQFFPLYSLVVSTREMNQVGLTKHSCMQYCDYLTTILPNVDCNMATLCSSYPVCCVRENPYFDWEEPGVLRYIVCMLGAGVVFWFLLMMLEYNWIQKLLFRERKAPPLNISSLEPDVADEVRHAERVATFSSDHCLVARGLTKYYGNNLAVDQISFSVGQSECFGLLGVNGAGKTTTFKMLMGDETVSSGDAFVRGYSVRKNITKVHENIGYCPQFDAVFGELTGRETLHLFSRMRGLRDPNSPVRAETLANALGFAKHLDKRVDQYSGGNRRKLSTAVSLLGGTRLVFVDEPTTGVDPAAKRHVWRAVRAARRSGRSVVLTSHSMEECEALCSRLTIMVNGRFSCLGSPQHLKNKFSQGYTLTIKLNAAEEAARAPVAGRSRADAVKRYVTENYNDVKLMEEYQGLLTFYLPDRSVPWSRMFGTMERAKRDLDVENYSIMQTTLEQVFLQFTKYQRQNKIFLN